MNVPFKKAIALSAAHVLRLPVVRRFLKKDDGAAAVEFALVAAPFLALVFAIMETALVFFAGQTLETAAYTQSSRRQLRSVRRPPEDGPGSLDWLWQRGAPYATP